MRQESRRLREAIKDIQYSDELRNRERALVGISDATRRIREQIQQAVEAECDTILITGETGTGKDGFSPEAQNCLLNYDFPGNARELRNIVERAAILCRSGQILAENVNVPVSQKKDVLIPPTKSDEDEERRQILNALETAKWNRSNAAKILGISYSKLRYRMQKHNIS